MNIFFTGLTFLTLLAFVAEFSSSNVILTENAGNKVVERTSKIETIEIHVEDCSHCGMSPLGHIHVKVSESINDP